MDEGGAGFEIFMATCFMIIVLWVVAPRSFVGGYRFGETCCFHVEVYNMFNRNADIRVQDSRVYGSGRPYLKEMALIQ